MPLVETFFFSSLSYDENERLFRKDDFHRAVKSIRYRGIATRTILSRIFAETHDRETEMIVMIERIGRRDSL